MSSLRRTRSVSNAITFVGILWAVGVTSATRSGVHAADLTGAAVVSIGSNDRHQDQAIAMLVEEVERRTGVRWPVLTSIPAEGRPYIVVGRVPWAARFGQRWSTFVAENAGRLGAEGYCLAVSGDVAAPAVAIAGSDRRGVFFGVGRLLRELKMSTGRIQVDDELRVTTTPHYALRGHQLGYRPKTNAYDGWDLPQWEQYYRDLIVFGTNAVELVPPRTDDAATSPHFPRPQLEMITGMSRLADQYDLDVWIWFPALDRDYDQAPVLSAAVQEWQEVFAALPRLDAVFVPGGDPGRTPPKLLLTMLERQIPGLRAHHPLAQVWISPQSFNADWLGQFVSSLRESPPEWLTGIVYGPQVRVSLPELRQMVPERFPIRHYPDITHSRQCQYPVPDWDIAFALTEARECINPRPLAQAQVFRLLQPHTVGFVTYSEGCNDDLNKIVWSSLGWQPDLDVTEILRQYSGYFLGPSYRESFAQGLLALERNWQGPLMTNMTVDVTLQQFQAMEQAASTETLANWRFLMGLHRAYYDAYTRRRLIHETEYEQAALDALRQAPTTGALEAIAAAERMLETGAKTSVAQPLRDKIVWLADRLFETIRMQSSVERHQAIAIDRGATLDTLDWPLNDRRWLGEKLRAARQAPSDAERWEKLHAIVNRTNPGPGGFYDDLGNPSAQPHLVRGLPYDQDPASLQSARTGFEEVPDVDAAHAPAWPLSWIDHAESLIEAPLRMHYTQLDPSAEYRLRVVYAGDGPQKKLRLVANNGQTEIHPFMVKPAPVEPIEFSIPREATSSGELDLAWYREPGLGDNGRGCQVSEVWLIRVSPEK